MTTNKKRSAKFGWFMFWWLAVFGVLLNTFNAIFSNFAYATAALWALLCLVLQFSLLRSDKRFWEVAEICDQLLKGNHDLLERLEKKHNEGEEWKNQK